MLASSKGFKKNEIISVHKLIDKIWRAIFMSLWTEKQRQSNMAISTILNDEVLECNKLYKQLLLKFCPFCGKK